MNCNLESALEVLSRTPGALHALLHGQSDDWARRDEGPDTWSPYEVVGHLIHNEEANWIPRARECGFRPLPTRWPSSEAEGDKRRTLSAN